jgi:hypothetical protein
MKKSILFLLVAPALCWLVIQVLPPKKRIRTPRLRLQQQI